MLAGRADSGRRAATALDKYENIILLRFLVAQPESLL
jgi:hypothetical protein